MERKQLKKINEYLFNKKESIAIDARESEKLSEKEQFEQSKVLAVMLCNLQELGYTIPSSDFNKLYALSPDELYENIYQPLLAAAKEAKGAHVEHRILFEGFPDSVKNLNIDDLSNIRFISYFTTVIDDWFGKDALAEGSLNREFVNNALSLANEHMDKTYASVDAVRKEISSRVDKTDEDYKENAPRPVRIVGPEAYFDMVKNMLSARTSLSLYDREIVLYTVNNFNKELYMPEKIQFKETQSLLDKHNFGMRNLQNIDIKSIKDFERLLASLSDGDVTLSKKQTFRNFSNQERKFLFQIFKNAVENNGPIMVESAANKKTLRTMDNVLKNRLHFNRFDNTYNEFYKKAAAHETVMGAYERNMKEHKYNVAARILGKHSTTLLIQHAREIVGKAFAHLDIETKGIEGLSEADRKYMKDMEKTFHDAAKKTDIKTLLSLKNEIHKEHVPYKILQPKGPANDLLVKANTSIALSEKAIAMLDKAIESGFKYQIENLVMNGNIQLKQGTKVYIDKNLYGCPIPTVGRGDANKNRSLATGSKIPVNTGNIMRAMLYKRHHHDQFIDFSAGILDENYKVIGQVSWNNLQLEVRGQKIGYHSGDTMHCSGKGCSEIIDINLDLMKEKFPEAKYIMYNALMWDGNALNTCDELFMTLAPTTEFGAHKGEKLTKNPVCYDASEVQFKMDIVGEAKSAVPLLLDVDNGKVVVMNVQMNRQATQPTNGLKRHFNLPEGCECLENYASEISMKCFAANQETMVNIGELAKLYVEYTGAILVDKPELSDVAFMMDRVEVEDERPVMEGVENPERVFITPFDKDVITAELIPDPKTIKDVDEKDVKKEIEKDLHDEIQIER